MCLTGFKLSKDTFDYTSCAAPIFASMICLLQCATLDKLKRKLTNTELLKLIKDNVIDLEEKGFDCKTGHGLFILPKPWKIDFQKYIEMEDDDMPRYNTLEEVPEWGKATIEKLMNLEVLKGDENGNLNLSYDLLRTLVIHDRLGLYD